MVLCKKNSKNYIVNLLADFILEKIGKQYDTIINVVDCTNFIVINGKTSSQEILMSSDVIKEFNEKFCEREITHTIDLIQYNQKIEPINKLKQIYYNSENCSYSREQIKNFYKENSKTSEYSSFLKEINDEQLVIASEFPFGYSLSQGRTLFYYGKHIFYSLSNYCFSDSLVMEMNRFRNDNNEIEFCVYDEYNTKDELLTSAVLDSFDFNYELIEGKMKKADWSVELTNPLFEYEILKKINKDLIIV